MNESNSSFLLFKSDGLFFLLPLEALERVVDAESMEEIPAAECLELLGQNGDLSKYRYRLLIPAGEDGEYPALPAEEVLGLAVIGKEQRMELPGQVRSGRNRYLEAAAQADTQEGRKVLAYILNPVWLGKLKDAKDENRT